MELTGSIVCWSKDPSVREEKNIPRIWERVG